MVPRGLPGDGNCLAGAVASGRFGRLYSSRNRKPGIMKLRLAQEAASKDFQGSNWQP